MLVLFDHGTPKGLARALAGHTILTADRRIRHQQNLRARRIALVVLTGSTKWSRVRRHADRIVAVVAPATRGSYSEVAIPFEPKPGRA